MGEILKALINGFGSSILPFWKDMIPFAGSIFILLFIFEILREAINISTGKGIDLASKLLVVFFVGSILLGYGKFSRGIYRAAVDISETVVTDFGNINKRIEESYLKGSKRHEAALEKSGDEAGFFEGFFIGMVTAILSGISLMIMFFIMILILVFIAGAYASLALVLAVGPVFVSMLVSGEFRSIGVKWALICLAYLLMIPIYIMVMRMMIDLFGQNAYNRTILNPSSLSVSASVEQMILLMAGPLISLGLVFSVSRIVDQIIGTAGNVGQTAIAAGASMMIISRSAIKGAMSTAKSIGRSAGKSSNVMKNGRSSGFSGNQGGNGKNISGNIVSGNKQKSGNGNKNGIAGEGTSSLRGQVSLNANPPRISELKKADSKNRDNNIPGKEMGGIGKITANKINRGVDSKEDKK